MKTKSAFLLGVLLLFLASCSKEKEASPNDPCGFDVSLDWVKARKACYTIRPENKNAYYLSLIVYPDGDSPEEKADMALSLMKLIYDFFGGEDDGDSFANTALYSGDRTFHSFISQVLLEEDSDYWLLVFQVDPVERTRIGDLITIEFHTPAVSWSPLTFDCSVDGDMITITPSDPAAPYVWDCEATKRIRDNYLLTETYLYSLVDMYEEYDFIDTRITKGALSVSLSEIGGSFVEGESYTIAAAGYYHDEINSDVYSFEFTY